MQISSLTFCSFRCFGPEPTTISTGDITAIIGENGAGKSAALMGLVRMFGLTGHQRTIQADDFFLPTGVSRDDPETKELSLWIEARLVFPELAHVNQDDNAIPQHFKQMLVSEPGGDPFCRVRLRATWQRGNLPEGEVDQSLCWVAKPGDVSNPVVDEDCIPLTAFERQRIHVHYIPGARDPSQHVRVSSKSLLKRLLDAAKWNDELQSEVESNVEQIADSFEDQDAIKQLSSELNDAWKTLYNRSRFTEVKLELEAQVLQDFVSSFTARMKTDSADETVPVDRLSDGLRSLLYFAIVQSAFRIEQQALDNAENSAFDVDVINPPLLTVFAVEEPETHLAPHLLGRVMRMFRTIAASSRAQAVFSSHSASVLSRVAPEEIRHLRLDPATSSARISTIAMPADGSDADKFVRQAIRAFPELYFARLVVLGEGDSEEVVLGRLLEAYELPSDPNVISVVPLGGRHVNHFWRLLNSLSIPYVTLLDLDRERDGGGWSRIHYVSKQLLELGIDRKEVIRAVSDEEFDEVPEWSDSDLENMQEWLSDLESLGVFFSSPLDLDFSMMKAFGKKYIAVASGKPHAFSDDADKKEKQITGLVKTVFGDRIESVSTYSEKDMQALRWYRYLFLNGSKPATHVAALSSIDDADLNAKVPSELGRLLEAIKARLENA